MGLEIRDKQVNHKATALIPFFPELWFENYKIKDTLISNKKRLLLSSIELLKA